MYLNWNVLFENKPSGNPALTQSHLNFRLNSGSESRMQISIQIQLKKL
jgi:hypothetical protein